MRNTIAKRLNKLARLSRVRSRNLKRIWSASPKNKRSVKDIDTHIAKLMYGDGCDASLVSLGGG